MHAVIIDYANWYHRCGSFSNLGDALMDQIKQLLFQRLEDAGIGSASASGLMRDVANCLHIDGAMSLSEVNRRLNYLGWADSLLDYHTFQLLVAWIEDQLFSKSPRHDELPAGKTPQISGIPA